MIIERDRVMKIEVQGGEVKIRNEAEKGCSSTENDSSISIQSLFQFTDPRTVRVINSRQINQY